MQDRVVHDVSRAARQVAERDAYAEVSIYPAEAHEAGLIVGIRVGAGLEDEALEEPGSPRRVVWGHGATLLIRADKEGVGFGSPDLVRTAKR